MVRSWLYSLLGLIGFLVGSYLLFTYGLPVVMPFAVALILAEVIDPVVDRLTWRGRVPRTAAVGIVLVLFVGLIMTAVTTALAKLVQEIQHVSVQLPDLYTVAYEMTSSIVARFSTFHASLPLNVQQMFLENTQRLVKSLSDSLPSLASALMAFTGLPAFLANSFVALIATFFISRDKREIFDFLLSLFPGQWRPKIQKVKVDVWASSMGFAKAHMLLILMTMVQSMIGLAVIGANYAVTLGVVIGLADLMPVLGPAAVYVPWILYLFIFGSTTFAIKLVILWAIVTGIRQLIEPKLLGERIGLHPLALLFSVYVGFHFFGAAGFVVGPLLAILMKSMIKSGLLPNLGN